MMSEKASSVYNPPPKAPATQASAIQACFTRRITVASNAIQTIDAAIYRFNRIRPD